jgi:hypothetical protein
LLQVKSGRPSRKGSDFLRLTYRRDLFSEIDNRPSRKESHLLSLFSCQWREECQVSGPDKVRL